MKASIAQITFHNFATLVALITNTVGELGPLQLFPLIVLVCWVVLKDNTVAFPTLRPLAPSGSLRRLAPSGSLGPSAPPAPSIASFALRGARMWMDLGGRVVMADLPGEKGGVMLVYVY